LTNTHPKNHPQTRRAPPPPPRHKKTATKPRNPAPVNHLTTFDDRQFTTFHHNETTFSPQKHHNKNSPNPFASYHKKTMKLASSLLLAALTVPALAQTATPTPKPKAPIHHTAATASSIPKVAGIPKTLYAIKYIDIKTGTGALAQPHKFYTVHYTGWFPDGTKFDSSVDRGIPFTFPYGAHRVITGWDTGFQGMHTGGKRRLFVPYQLAYGELGNPPHMPAKANLIFDVEFISQSDTPPEQPRQPAPPAPPAPAPPAPKPAAEPAPADATPPADKPATPPQPQTPPHPEAL
jgi:peptidylprolyl isomerase